MKSDEYKTISGTSEGLYKEKGSKFIALAYPVSTEEEVKHMLTDLRKTYYDARHHCYAYRLGHYNEKYRHNDDGEPSGTAGKPIYGQLLSNELTDILIVVIRYFGGTKLGVSGLINAYRSAAKEAIANARVNIKTVQREIQLEFEYPLMNAVMKLVKETSAEIVSQQMELSCRFVITVRDLDFSRVTEHLDKTKGITYSVADEQL